MIRSIVRFRGLTGKVSAVSIPKSRNGKGYPIFISKFPLIISPYGSWISANAITAKKTNPKIVASLFVGSRCFGMPLVGWSIGGFPMVLYSGILVGAFGFCITSFSILMDGFYL